MRYHKLWCVLIPVLFVVACSGDGSNLTGPSNEIPNVAGNYSGTTTIAYPELGNSVSCSTTTSVTQTSGGRVSIAPLQLRGECGTMSIPLGDFTIDATGSLGQESGTVTMSCGVYNAVGGGGFFGRRLEGSYVYTSRTCYNMNVTISLTR